MDEKEKVLAFIFGVLAFLAFLLFSNVGIEKIFKKIEEREKNKINYQNHHPTFQFKLNKSEEEEKKEIKDKEEIAGRLRDEMRTLKNQNKKTSQVLRTNRSEIVPSIAVESFTDEFNKKRIQSAVVDAIGDGKCGYHALYNALTANQDTIREQIQSRSPVRGGENLIHELLNESNENTMREYVQEKFRYLIDQLNINTDNFSDDFKLYWNLNDTYMREVDFNSKEDIKKKIGAQDEKKSEQELNTISDLLFDMFEEIPQEEKVQLSSLDVNERVETLRYIFDYKMAQRNENMTNEVLRRFRDRIAKPGVMIDANIITFIAKVYNINIHIYMPAGGSTIDIIQGKHTKKDVYIRYVGGIHYQVLYPLRSKPIDL